MSDTLSVVEMLPRHPGDPGVTSSAGDLFPGAQVTLPTLEADRLVQQGLARFLSGLGGVPWERDGAGRGGIDPANPFPVFSGSVILAARRRGMGW